MWLLFSLSLLHEMQQYFPVHFDGLLRVVCSCCLLAETHSPPEKAVSKNADGKTPMTWREWVSERGWYLLLIEVPSIVFPPLFEWLYAGLSVSTWIMWVSIILLICTARLLEEGAMVVPPFRLLQVTLIKALPQVLAFSTAMSLVMLVVAEVHGECTTSSSCC